MQELSSLTTKGFDQKHATLQELYGGPVAGAVTGALSRLFTTYVQHLGFTCGMGDLLLSPAHEAAREELLAAAEGLAVATGGALAAVPLPPLPAAAGGALLRAAEARVRAALRPRYRQTAQMAVVHDQRSSSALNPCASAVTKACFPTGLVRPFQRNCMSLMTTTGAKGGLVNFSQITAMLGQQDLEGRRVPRMASGKTLPSFHAFDAGARSCGFVADRFLSGAFSPVFCARCKSPVRLAPAFRCCTALRPVRLAPAFRWCTIRSTTATACPAVVFQPCFSCFTEAPRCRPAPATS